MCLKIFVPPKKGWIHMTQIPNFRVSKGALYTNIPPISIHFPLSPTQYPYKFHIPSSPSGWFDSQNCFMQKIINRKPEHSKKKKVVKSVALLYIFSSTNPWFNGKKWCHWRPIEESVSEVRWHAPRFAHGEVGDGLLLVRFLESFLVNGCNMG